MGKVKLDTKTAGIGEEAGAERLWSLQGHAGQETTEGFGQEANPQVQSMSDGGEIVFMTLDLASRLKRDGFCACRMLCMYAIPFT